ncbi:hypothetical protein KKC17_03665 [Patescibacteria group bacterium]|nr:hypothetical protein [Patescibacteria group bacterium]
MSWWFNIIFGIVLWLVRQALATFNPLLADAVLLAWPIYLVWQMGFLKPWTALLVASFLIDVITFSNWPVYTIAAFLSGIIYRQFIEDFLAESSNLGRALNMFAWVISWRLIRWGVMWLGWRLGFDYFLPVSFSWLSWLSWLGYIAGVLIILSIIGWYKVKFKKTFNYV